MTGRLIPISPRTRGRSLAFAAPLLIAFAALGAQAAPASPAPGLSADAHTPATLVKTASTRSRKRARRHYAPAPSVGSRLGLRKTPDEFALKSSAAMVVDQDSGETLTSKNPDAVLPIASLTKLMTALVVIESALPLDETLEIGADDVDKVKKTSSRLRVGTRLTRDQMLLLALMSSENRASMALSRHYPGGRAAFLARMNAKAGELGMASTRFADAAGLSAASVSTARDLVKLVAAADRQPLIRQYSTQGDATLKVGRSRLKFVNSNRLIRKRAGWNIALQKTGFTNEAGRCLVMQATVLGRRVAMIFLDSSGSLTRYADAKRVRQRLEAQARQPRSDPAKPTATVAATT